MADRKDAIAAKYSREWKRWDDLYADGGNDSEPFYVRRRDEILRLIDEHAGGKSLRVLDLGCGSGSLAVKLLERGHSVLGVDISEVMVEKAQELADSVAPGRAEFEVGDVEHLRFAEQSFDVVVAAGVLSHQADDEPTVREMHRVVKRGGAVLFSLPSRILLAHLFDPEYYFRVIRQIVNRLRRRDAGEPAQAPPSDTRNADSLAAGILIRRYRYRQLDGLLESVGFAQPTTVAVGYGPLTFLGRRFGSTKMWLRFSNTLESAASWTVFGPLRHVPRFWIVRTVR